MGPETVQGLLRRGTMHYEAEGKGGRLMTTGNHTHDRPMVNWCSYWQVMAADHRTGALVGGDGRQGQRMVQAVLTSDTGPGSPGPERRAITLSRPFPLAVMAAKHNKRRHK
jgi:hypothetical protein